MSKKFFISADIEGVTDVTFWAETEDGGEGNAAARTQMTREVAAACEAVVESGNIAVVRDGHGNAKNISHIDLPEGTELMRGWACHPGSMMAGIDSSYSGAIYIGYHAPGGSNGSPLAHTLNHEKVEWIKINGRLASEFTMNSNYAASYAVPSIFISGDAVICRMAKEEIPTIAAVAVKKCRGNSTWNMHPVTAAEEIKAAVSAQIALLEQNPEAFSPQLPERLVLEVCLKNQQSADLAARLPNVERVDELTVRYAAKTPEELNIAFENIIG